MFKTKERPAYRTGKERQRVNARSLFCFWAVRELGFSLSASITDIWQEYLS